MPKTIQVGDSIKSLAACDRIEPGTIVGYAHPLYQSPISAVRVETADGTRYWEESGSRGLKKTRTIKQATGWAPFVVLSLPGTVLNDEVRIGYRTYGKPEGTAV